MARAGNPCSGQAREPASLENAMGANLSPPESARYDPSGNSQNKSVKVVRGRTPKGRSPDRLPCRGARLQRLRPGSSSRTEARSCCPCQRLIKVRELRGCARGRLDLRVNPIFGYCAVEHSMSSRFDSRRDAGSRGRAQTKIHRFPLCFDQKWKVSSARPGWHRPPIARLTNYRPIIDCLPRREKQAAARKDLRVSRAIDASRSRRLKNGRSCFRSQCRLAV